MLEKSWHGATSLSLLPLSLSQINTQSDFVKDKKLDATINQDLHYTLNHLYIPGNMFVCAYKSYLQLC